MGENSHIEWTDHTFNPWIGCTKVSPGCAHCYAEQATFVRAQRKRGRELWGEGRERWRTSEESWHKPRVWNDRAAALGVRQRVFCASLADWLDDAVPIEWLADLLALIFATPHLDWLLLTKRPQNWKFRMHWANGRLASAGNLAAFESCPKMQAAFRIAEWAEGAPPANVWLGTTVEDQARADERIPALLGIPAVVRFLSCEPLLSEVRLDRWLWCHSKDEDGIKDSTPSDAIDWVICGGESGPKARPMHPEWARSLRDQCVAAAVTFFFKQWGDWLPISPGEWDGPANQAGSIFRPNTKPGDLWLRVDGWSGDGPPSVWRPAEFAIMRRVGKKRAGRLLDGQEHNELPAGGTGGG